MTMENDIINKKILKVWEKYPDDSGKYLPVLYPTFKEGGILFIGLNPSLNRKAIKNMTKKEEKYQNVDIEEKLDRNSKDYDFVIWLEKEARGLNGNKAYPYFEKFDEISKKELKLQYNSIDLFYLRGKQNEAKKRIGRYKGRNFVLNEFGLSQIKIAIEKSKK